MARCLDFIWCSLKTLDSFEAEICPYWSIFIKDHSGCYVKGEWWIEGQERKKLRETIENTFATLSYLKKFLSINIGWLNVSDISIDNSSWLSRKYRETFHLPLFFPVNCFTPLFSWPITCNQVSYTPVASNSSWSLPYSVDYEIMIIIVIVIRLLVYMIVEQGLWLVFCMAYIIFPKNSIT